MRKIIEAKITQFLFHILTACAILTAGLIIAAYSTTDQINVPPVLIAILLLVSIIWFWVFIFRTIKVIHSHRSDIKNKVLVSIKSKDGSVVEFLVQPNEPFVTEDGRCFVLIQDENVSLSLCVQVEKQ